MYNSILSRPLCLLLLSFCAFTAHSQDILWEKSYCGKPAEFLFDAIPTPDYGFILAGSSTSGKGEFKKEDSKGNADFWIIKADTKGREIWKRMELK